MAQGMIFLRRIGHDSNYYFQFLRDYFYAGGEGPVPLEVLQNQKYRDVVSIRLYYDWTT